MSITGQLSKHSGHFRSNCGCLSVIRVTIDRPFPVCPMCLRATSWTEKEVPGAAKNVETKPDQFVLRRW